jgi:hypothetical protein
MSRDKHNAYHLPLCMETACESKKQTGKSSNKGKTVFTVYKLPPEIGPIWLHSFPLKGTV